MEGKLMSQGRKAVRVVARVRSTADEAMEPSVNGSLRRSVSVHKPKGDESEKVSIFFGDQSASNKDSYKLDFCYKENDDTVFILTKEIKPLISELFDGREATIIAHGPKGSGKTYLIQGSDMEPGLAVLAMSEILHMAEEKGYSVSVSLYEVSQENVYDILDREKSMISILEDAQGKVHLKGLSQLPVKSLSEFQHLYFREKKLREPPHRSHKGLMIHVSPCNPNSRSLGRMNFLDLAGYEDPRRQNNNCKAPLEITRINKSIYALQNVMYALNANECYVPYRGSKLTHMLRDSLQGPNRILLVTCLRSAFCQDSVYTVSSASRICLGCDRSIMSSTKKVNGLTRPTVLSSQRNQLPLTVSATARKQTGSRGDLAGRKPKVNNTMTSALKGRKLFGEASSSLKSKMDSSKEISSFEIISNVQYSKLEDVASCELKPNALIRSTVLKESSFSAFSSSVTTLEVESSFSAFSSSVTTMEVEHSTLASFSSEAADAVDKGMHLEDEENVGEAGRCVDNSIADDMYLDDKAVAIGRENSSSLTKEDLASPDACAKLDKENNWSLANKSASPPLIVRFQELSNKMKSLHNSLNPPCVEAPEKSHAPLITLKAEELENNDTISDAITNAEPRTPERSTISNICYSPWKTFSAHGSKVKNSVVDGYLKFLNTAEKEDLKKLKGIGEKRATYILELREESPEPFKSLEDLKEIGLSEKQVKGMLKQEIGGIFD